jgi:hypothetical protein
MDLLHSLEATLNRLAESATNEEIERALELCLDFAIRIELGSGSGQPRQESKTENRVLRPN